MENQIIERLRIRELVENWALWRDAGDWDRFRTLWSEDGTMMATWTQGSAEEFIRASIDGWNKGVRILHFLGGTSTDLSDDRAISQTKMTITQRAEVEGVQCDVICTGRFYDFLRRIDNEWKLVLRQPIYEMDRMNSIVPGLSPTLDSNLLSEFPTGYKHLAYLQTRIGYQVKKDMPGIAGPEVEALYFRGRKWLAHESAQP
ncbi:MAG: nuclear transport factor 2 family protein [Acidimicrobiaceae bacterium]|nr:nuclear transport factor 2 family protein [Acidimicrobiaceae bacterium]